MWTPRPLSRTLNGTEALEFTARPRYSSALCSKRLVLIFAFFPHYGNCAIKAAHNESIESWSHVCKFNWVKKGRKLCNGRNYLVYADGAKRPKLLEPFSVDLNGESRTSALTLASGSLLFPLQGSIQDCPAAKTYGIRFSASTSSSTPLLTAFHLPLKQGPAKYK